MATAIQKLRMGSRREAAAAYLALVQHATG